MNLFIILISMIISMDGIGKFLIPCESAPSFKLRDQNAEMISLDFIAAETRSPIIIVNFFQTTCAPCLNEIFHLTSIYNQKKLSNKESFEMVLISSKEERTTVRKFLAKHNINFKYILIDQFGVLDDKYFIKSIPRTIIINKNKQILRDISGSEMSYLISTNKFEKIIDDFIKKPLNCSLKSKTGTGAIKP